MLELLQETRKLTNMNDNTHYPDISTYKATRALWILKQSHKTVFSTHMEQFQTRQDISDEAAVRISTDKKCIDNLLQPDGVSNLTSVTINYHASKSNHQKEITGFHIHPKLWLSSVRKYHQYLEKHNNLNQDNHPNTPTEAYTMLQSCRVPTNM